MSFFAGSKRKSDKKASEPQPSAEPSTLGDKVESGTPSAESVASGAGNSSSEGQRMTAPVEEPLQQPGEGGEEEATEVLPAEPIVLKCGLLGDPAVGKSSMMTYFVEGRFTEDDIATLGVSTLEKTVRLRGNPITYSIFDVGGSAEFSHMLPLVCNDAVALIFMFDLSRRSSLLNIKEWYGQARQYNKSAHCFLVGSKFDLFALLPPEEQADIDKLARKYAKAMKSPLVFTSSSHAINVQKLFKLILAKAFDIKCNIQPIDQVGEPILLI